MPLDIVQFSSNLARWRRAALLDRLILEQRQASARASLVCNPFDGGHYAVSAELSQSTTVNAAAK